MARLRKTVRVYISSTFSDFHAERDYLVRVVFPELREKCAQRGLDLVEVDLRWGITEESLHDGSVLELLLEEIDRCRPFFIGLVGERYGWIPRHFPPRLVLSYPWIDEYAGRSILEIEFAYTRHGIKDGLSSPLFLLRDADVLSSVPEAELSSFVEPYEGSRSSLEKMKATLQSSACAVRDYSCYWDNATSRIDGLQDFGRMVYSHLWNRIDRLYPLPPELPPVIDPYAEEDEAQSLFEERYSRDPTFDDAVMSEARAYVENGKPKPLVVMGHDRSQRLSVTTTLAQSIDRDFPDALVLRNHVGATPNSSDLRYLLARFTHCLSGTSDTSIPRDLGRLRSAFFDVLNQAGSNRPVILVFSESHRLNASGGALTLDWLPRELPPQVRVIVGISPASEGDPGALSVAHERIRRDRWPTIDLLPLSNDNIVNLVSSTLSNYGKKLSDQHVALVVRKPSAGDADYLRLLLAILRQKASYENLDDLLIQFPGTTEDAYDHYLSVLEQDYDPNITFFVLAAVAASPNGLDEDRLASLVGSVLNIPILSLKQFLRCVSPFMMRRGTLLDYSDLRFWRAVSRRYLTDRVQARELHNILGQSYLQTSVTTSGQLRDDLDATLLESLPFHLQMSLGFQELENVLTDFRFLRLVTERVSVWETVDSEGRPRFNYEGYFSVLKELDALLGARPNKADIDQSGVASLLREVWSQREDFIVEPHSIEAALYADLRVRETEPVEKYDVDLHVFKKKLGPVRTHCELQRTLYEDQKSPWIKKARLTRNEADPMGLEVRPGPPRCRHCRVKPHEGSEPYLFVSFAHDDDEVVYPLVEKIYDMKYPVWYDQGLKFGQEWTHEIAERIDGCSLCLVCFSPSAIESKYVSDEIHYAYSHNIPLYCVNLQPVQLPKSMELRIGRFQNLDIWSVDFDSRIRDGLQSEFDKSKNP